MKCPLCGSSQFIFDREKNEYICSSCGYVVKGGFFEDVGGLNYYVGSHGEIGSSSDMSSVWRGKYGKLKKINQRVMSPKERKLLKVYYMIDYYAGIVGLPKSMVDDAKFLSKKFYDDFLKINAELMGLTFVVVEAKLYGIPLNKKRMYELVGKKNFNKVLRLARMILSKYKSNAHLSNDIFSAWDFVSDVFFLRDCSYELGLRILKETKDSFGVRYKARWVYIGAIVDIVRYLCCLDFSQEELASKIGVSAVGIRITRKKLLEDLGVKSLEELKEVWGVDDEQCSSKI